MKESQNNLDNENKKKKKIILLIMCLTAVLLIVFLFFQQKGTNLLNLDPSAQEYEGQIKKPEEWAEDKIAFPAFNQVNVLEGSEHMYVALMNPSFNSAYLQFEVYLEGETEPLLTTGLVKPGQAVTKVPIPDNLSIGEHMINLHIQGYAPGDEQTELNGTKTSFSLIVLKVDDESTE